MARIKERARGVATLLLVLQLILLVPAPASSQAAAGLRNIPKLPIIKQFAKELGKEVATNGGSALIKQALGSSSDGAQLGAAAADNSSFIGYSVSVGATGQSLSGVVDIFTDFIWAQCPPAPLISNVPCDSPTCQNVLSITAANCGSSAAGGGYCEYEYGLDEDGTKTTGNLASVTLSDSRSLVFGCSKTLPLDRREYGAIGFSRGPLSILSQLHISSFSYFLTPDDSNSSGSTSFVLLGEQAVPQTKHSRSTPLLRSNIYPYLYYVKLTGIQVDGEPLTSIPAGAFDLAADSNSGGVVLSTTIAISYLQEDAYNAVRQALVNKIKSVPVSSSTSGTGLDLCYNMLSVAQLTLPKITFVFYGVESPAMELTTVHYFYKEYRTGLQCLTMLPTEAGQPSILGSMMQAGTNMIYDLSREQLTFERGAAALVPSKASLVLMVAASLILASVSFI